MRQRALISILVIANVVLASYVLGRNFISRYTDDPVPVAESNTLPLIDLVDDNDRRINTSTFVGSPLFVQFINPYVETQISSFVQIREHPPQTKVSWLLFTTNATHLRSHLPMDSNDIVVVEKNYPEMRKLFSVPGPLEYWMIFDEDGHLRDSGRYDGGQARSSLRHVADGAPMFSPAALADAFRAMDESGLLTRLHASATRSASGKLVVGLFSVACTGCSDSSQVALLDSASQMDQRNSYLILLPSTFSSGDLKNFKTNLSLRIAVSGADTRFTQEWQALNQRYGEKQINGTVLLIDGEKIVSVVNGVSETKRLLSSLREQ